MLAIRPSPAVCGGAGRLGRGVSSGEPISLRLGQAGGCYGGLSMEQHGDHTLPIYRLIAGSTLVESAFLARERAPLSEQVVASFATPLPVRRRALSPSLVDFAGVLLRCFASQGPCRLQPVSLKASRSYAPRDCAWLAVLLAVESLPSELSVPARGQRGQSIASRVDEWAVDEASLQRQGCLGEAGRGVPCHLLCA